MDVWTIVLLVCTCWLWIPIGTVLAVVAAGCVCMVAFTVCLLPFMFVTAIADKIGSPLRR